MPLKLTTATGKIEYEPDTPSTEVARRDSWSKELVRAIAMDIGKAAVHHLEVMYPKAVEAVPPNMKLSLRNCIHNEIIAALETSDADEIMERLRSRRAHRRDIKAAYTKVRR